MKAVLSLPCSASSLHVKIKETKPSRHKMRTTRNTLRILYARSETAGRTAKNSTHYLSINNSNFKTLMSSANPFIPFYRSRTIFFKKSTLKYCNLFYFLLLFKLKNYYETFQYKKKKNKKKKELYTTSIILS
jgi:hypothetical protein